MDVEFSDEQFNEFRKQYGKLLKSGKIKKCFFNDESCEVKRNGEVAIIDAHSISRGSTLNLIKGTVSSNEKVIILNEIQPSKNGVVQKPTAQGWQKEASIFNGFCGEHDREVFKPIENGIPFDNTDEQCFLHSFRSFAFSYHKLKEMEKLSFNVINNGIGKGVNGLDQIEKMKETFCPLLETLGTTDFNDLVNTILSTKSDNVESLVRGLEIKNGKKVPSNERKKLIDDLSSNPTILKFLNTKFDLNTIDLNKLSSDFKKYENEFKEGKESEKVISNVLYEPIRRRLIDIHDRKSFNELKYVVRIFRETYPVASAECFFPRFISEDDICTYLPSSDNLNPCLMLTVIPDEFKRTIVILSCFQKDLNACYYLTKIGSLSDEKFRKAISGIMIHSCSTNTFLNPRMWDEICFNDEDKLLSKEITKKRPFDKLDKGVYLSLFNFFQDKYVLKKENVRH